MSTSTAAGAGAGAGAGAASNNATLAPTNATSSVDAGAADLPHGSPSRHPPSRSYSNRSRPLHHHTSAASTSTSASASASGPPTASRQSHDLTSTQPRHHHGRTANSRDDDASARNGSNSHSQSYGQHQQPQHPKPHTEHRSQLSQHNQYPKHRTSSSSTRPIQEILPQNDYETSRLASHLKRSSSRDRPPPITRGVDVSRQHGRSSSTRSTHRPPHQANMAPAATADHAGGDSQAANMPPKHARSRTAIPTQSGKWILGKTIGAGSMGKVKLARKEDGTEQVACKIIPRGSVDDGHQSRADKERADQSKEVRTAREAAIVTLLNHPHICGLRDVVRTNYHWYMLFEYVNGGQMLDYIISHGKLKEKQARKFSRQIASALDYCHRNSIVHRDLKIENILISKTGDIKIIDFGLSNLFAPRGHLKTFCGSLYFAAPELLQAKAYIGPEVDVWSFGIVLYVLVCGKVPFDDQSMPALHAKIKKGFVDYPSNLGPECKHLLSRMLVTDPKQRASMQEVMNHSWMVKGFSGPPENYVPPREPLLQPLDNDVLHAMQGFNFGSPESIRAQLLKIIESDEYQRAIEMYRKEREVSSPRDGEKKRGFGFDFYKRRNSNNSRDTLTVPSSEALQLGNDPLNAFNPLLSIYYLVREKQNKERADGVLPPSVTIPQGNEKEKRRDAESTSDRDHDYKRDKLRERGRDRDRDRDRDRGQDPEKHQSASAPAPVPEVTPPKAAYTNPATYEMPGEQPTGGRTRPRARTHGEDDAPENVKQARASSPTEPKADSSARKEGTAVGLLRRFSTRKRKDPERSEKDRSHPPVVQVHSPAEPMSTVPKKSFSIRRGRRDGEDTSGSRLFSGSSRGQHSELLSPPSSAGEQKGSRQSGGLGRSTSVNSADMRRRVSSRSPRDGPPATSGSEQSVATDQPSGSQRTHGHSKSVSLRAKSLGHARRESIQRRRLRRGAAQESNVPEETDAELEHDQAGNSTERLDSSDLAKPVYLRGLFSVSTTSGKSVPAIRVELRRVLRQLHVEYVEIKGGFTCKHSPSIDLSTVQEYPGSPSMTPGHRRRFSFGGLIRGEDRDKDELRDPADRPPTTPRTPGRSERERSVTNSETSVDSIPRRNGNASRRQPGETSTQVQSDLEGNMVLEFDIFIVKVPLLTLHGIQFKRMAGNTWQFKNMADQILKEVRL